jgi:4-amino-4-deoxy-L-arabinose transferase-like glycosyltransferase
MMQLFSLVELPTPPNRGLSGRWAVLERLAHHLTTSPRTTVLALTAAIVVGLLASLGPLTANRLHRDEAIYSSWGLDIASGRDLLLSASPVDKPPLFFYIQALSFLLFGPSEVAARIPSLAASVVSLELIYLLGRSLYGRGVGLLAAFLLAASPFAILFAPTAFTDPLMVTWVLAGCLAAVRGCWGWAGLFLGLAAITKQQGVFFVPLVLGLGFISNTKSRIPPFFVTFLAVLGLALAWDMARSREPGFLAQSLISYGGLPLSFWSAWEHLLSFGSLLRYGTGSSVLNMVLLIGLPSLVVLDTLTLLGRSRTLSRRSDLYGQGSRQARADLILMVFMSLFLIGHSLFAFAVWDRYLLGLIPWLALLLARVLTLPSRIFSDSPLGRVPGRVFVLAMLTFTLRPVRDAAASRLPVGGDHGAYQGIEQVANYFQAVPADTTLYHRWLGWHWRFYLWGSPYDFPAWTSPGDLARQAATRPGARRYVVFPSWRSATEARLALADAGLAMRDVAHAFRDDGSLSFVVYRIEEAP